MEIILLRITSYGWGMIVLAALSVLIALKIWKRKNKDSKPGCLGIGYISLIVFCLFSLSVMLVGMLGRFLVNVITLPRYQARVIDFYAFQDKDSKNRSVTMFQPVVTFAGGDGRPVTIKTDISSSGKKPVGELLTVGYEPGMATAEELSGNKYILIGGACVMLLVMGYFVLAGIAYAMGRRMQPFYSVGIGILLYFIFPVAMLFLLGGMAYAVILYFMGQKPDMPVWAVAVCSFFSLVLCLSFIGYVRMLTERRRRIGQA